jgi:hypothetical protein
MAQDAVDYTNQIGLAWGRTALGSNWPSSGLSEAQIISLGLSIYANASKIPTTEPSVQAPQILFNQQPAPLSSGGIQIPNSSVVFKSPA